MAYPHALQARNGTPRRPQPRRATTSWLRTAATLWVWISRSVRRPAAAQPRSVAGTSRHLGGGLMRAGWWGAWEQALELEAALTLAAAVAVAVAVT